MYKHYASLILGFHACERAVGLELVNKPKKVFQPSENHYDWLGHGMYFWENSPDRAADFGKELKKKEVLKDPIVIGAAIHLGYCFDLSDFQSLQCLKEHYEALRKTCEKAKIEMPKNHGGPDNLLRTLDCAVFEYMHGQMKEKGDRQFDSVRGIFWEGDNLYLNAGFKEKNHIQICIRNPNCIKGYFLPKPLNSGSKWARV